MGQPTNIVVPVYAVSPATGRLQGRWPYGNQPGIFANSQQAQQALAALSSGAGSGISIANGVITIAGSGFGSAILPAPLYYDDYELRTVGAIDTTIGLADLQANGGVRPRVANDRSYTGTKSLKMPYPVGPYSAAGVFPTSGILTTQGSDRIYTAYWLYWTHTTGTQPHPIFKLSRGGSGSPYSGSPRFYETIQPNAAGNAVDGNDCGYVTTNIGTIRPTTWVNGTPNKPQTAGSWHFCEYFYRLGNGTGLLESWVDGVKNMNAGNWFANDQSSTVYTPRSTTTLAPSSSAVIDWIMSPFDGLDSYGTSDAYDVWVDNLTLDISGARVVLTDSATYASSTQWLYQPRTSWADGLVTATLKAGNFASGQTGYFHLFNADNVRLNTYPAVLP